MELFLRPPPGAQLDPGLPLRVAVDALERAATLRPVLLLLDDVQWSRGQATALVDALRAREPQPAVCILATARADDADERAARNAFRKLDGVAYVPVDPLDAAKTRQLVRGLLDVDDGLCELLASRAEGNPLFVTQLLGQLVVEEAVERRDGRFRLARAVDLAGVPADIASVWRRRVARSGAARRDLAALALVRQRVALGVAGALAAAVGGSFEESITQALASGLVHLEDGEYRWAHGLLRDYLLRDIDAGALPELAAAAATALEPLVGREDVQAERARHLSSAGKHRAACEALLAAGIWSFYRAEPAPRTERFELLTRWTEAQGFDDLAARAHVELGLRAAEIGDADGAETHVARADARLAASGDVATRAWVALQSSRIARLAGRLDLGMQRMHEALDAARAADVAEVEALALMMLALDRARAHQVTEAHAHYAAAIARFREAGNLAGEAQALLCVVSISDETQGLALAERGIELAREAGAVRVELMGRQLSITWLWDAGRRAEAMEEAARVLDQAARRGLRQTASLVELTSAELALQSGDWAAAARHRDGAVSWGAPAGAVPERVHLHAIDYVLTAQRGDQAATASARAAFDAVRGDFADDDLARTLRVVETLSARRGGLIAPLLDIQDLVSGGGNHDHRRSSRCARHQRLHAGLPTSVKINKGTDRLGRAGGDRRPQHLGNLRFRRCAVQHGRDAPGLHDDHRQRDGRRALAYSLYRRPRPRDRPPGRT